MLEPTNYETDYSNHILDIHIVVCVIYDIS